MEVIIEIVGGVAYVVQKSQGVKVILRDWDNATSDDGIETPSEDIYEDDEVIIKE
jgi:hypothetical protein